MTDLLSRPDPSVGERPVARRPRLSRRLPGPFDALTLPTAAVLITIVVVPLTRVVVGLHWVDGSLTWNRSAARRPPPGPVACCSTP